MLLSWKLESAEQIQIQRAVALSVLLPLVKQAPLGVTFSPQSQRHGAEVTLWERPGSWSICSASCRLGGQHCGAGAAWQLLLLPSPAPPSPGHWGTLGEALLFQWELLLSGDQRTMACSIPPGSVGPVRQSCHRSGSRPASPQPEHGKSCK